MNLLPRISNTVALLPLQGDTHDISGNGLNATVINNVTMSPGGTEQYGAIDSCISGFKFDTGTELVLPSSPLLRLAGPWTIQFLLLDSRTTGGNQPFFCLADPAGRSGGGGADRIGSIFTFYWSTLTPGTHPYWTDVTHGSNLPQPGGLWWDTTDTQWGLAPGVPNAIAVRYNSDGVAGHASSVDLFLNGIKQASTGPLTGNATTTPTIVGNERFYIGGMEGGTGQTPTLNTILGDLRILNVARSDASILADAMFATGACGSTPVPPVSEGPGAAYTPSTASVSFMADAGRIYRYRPGHMPQLKGNR